MSTHLPPGQSVSMSVIGVGLSRPCLCHEDEDRGTGPPSRTPTWSSTPPPLSEVFRFRIHKCRGVGETELFLGESGEHAVVQTGRDHLLWVSVSLALTDPSDGRVRRV